MSTRGLHCRSSRGLSPRKRTSRLGCSLRARRVIAIMGYACKPAANLLARAEMLLDGVTDQRLLVLALSAPVSAYVRGDTTKALATAERLAALGEATSDMDQRITARVGQLSACLPRAVRALPAAARVRRFREP